MSKSKRSPNSRTLILNINEIFINGCQIRDRFFIKLK